MPELAAVEQCRLCRSEWKCRCLYELVRSIEMAEII